MYPYPDSNAQATGPTHNITDKELDRYTINLLMLELDSSIDIEAKLQKLDGLEGYGRMMNEFKVQ